MWVCIGHSHTVALLRGAEMQGFDLDIVNFWLSGDPWVRNGAEISLRPDLAERIGRAPLVLSHIGGSAHCMLGMVEHWRPFDFVLPSAPDLPVDERRELVPAEAIREKLTQMAWEYLETVPAVIRAASGTVIQLEPPPPLADSALIAPRVPWDFFPGQPHAIAPKWLRYKLWRMHSEVAEAACAEFGIRYFRAPARAMDEDGFLDLRYDGDGTHANAAYGALVLEDLRRAA